MTDQEKQFLVSLLLKYHTDDAEASMATGMLSDGRAFTVAYAFGKGAAPLAQAVREIGDPAESEAPDWLTPNAVDRILADMDRLRIPRPLGTLRELEKMGSLRDTRPDPAVNVALPQAAQKLPEQVCYMCLLGVPHRH